jgi:uncharacterized protein YndB with AHSA1/START domain
MKIPKAIKAHMEKPIFTYTTHITTTPMKLWAAITGNEFWQQFSGSVDSDWKQGSTVRFFLPDGKQYSQGIVLQSEPPFILSHTWPDPDGKQSTEDCQRLTWQIETAGPGTLKLTLLHENMTENAYDGVKADWPTLIYGLKSRLEACIEKGLEESKNKNG